MIHLDTNFLIASLIPTTAQSNQVAQWIQAGEAISFSVVAWAEFLCGPVNADQAALAMSIFPDPASLTPADAARAAELFNATGRPRGTLADCMIAATCLRLGAAIATENLHDFQRFIPHGLKVLTAT